MAKRRYLQNMQTQAAMSALDNIMNNHYQAKLQQDMNDAAAKEEYLSLIFRNELAAQNEYRGFLMEEGVNLPEHLQSGTSYSDLVNNASGDSSSLDLIASLADQAKTHTKELQNIASTYKSGYKTSRRADIQAFANLDPSQPGRYSNVIFSPEEFDVLYDQKPELFGDLSERDLEIYKQGFLSGNYSQDEALEYINKENDRYESEMAIYDKNFVRAETSAVKALNHTNSDILGSINRIVNVEGAMQLVGIKDSYDDYVNMLEDIQKGEKYGLTTNGRVSNMIANAVSRSAGDKGLIPNKAFGELAVVSYRTSQDLRGYEEKYAMENGISIPNKTLQPKKYAEFQQRVLADEDFSFNVGNTLYDSEDYKSQLQMRDDFIKIGLWENRKVKDAVEDSDRLETIYEQHGQFSEQLVSDMEARGFDSSILNAFEDTQYNQLLTSEDFDIDKVNEIFDLNIEYDVDVVDIDDDETEIFESGVYDLKTGERKGDLPGEKIITDNELLNSLDYIAERKGELTKKYDESRVETSYEQALDFYFGIRSVSDWLTGTDFSEDEFEYLISRPDAAIIGWAAHRGAAKAGETRIKKDLWKDDTQWTGIDYKKALAMWKEANRQATPKGVWADIVRMSLASDLSPEAYQEYMDDLRE